MSDEANINSIVGGVEAQRDEREAHVQMSAACLLYVRQMTGDHVFELWSQHYEGRQVSEKPGVLENLLMLANKAAIDEGRGEVVDEDRIERWKSGITRDEHFIAIESVRGSLGKFIGVLPDRMKYERKVERILATLDETNIGPILLEQIKWFAPSEPAPSGTTAISEAAPSGGKVRIETIGTSTRAWVTLEAIPTVSALRTLALAVENPGDEAYQEATLELDTFPRTLTLASVASMETLTFRIKPGSKVTARYKTMNEHGILSDRVPPLDSGRIEELLTIIEEAKDGLIQGGFPTTGIEFITSRLRQAQPTNAA